MYGYIAFYKDRRHELYTNKGMYQAQLEAARYFGVPAKKSYLVHVALAELPDGKQYSHIAVD